MNEWMVRPVVVFLFLPGDVPSLFVCVCVCVCVCVLFFLLRSLLLRWLLMLLLLRNIMVVASSAAASLPQHSSYYVCSAHPLFEELSRVLLAFRHDTHTHTHTHIQLVTLSLVNVTPAWCGALFILLPVAESTNQPWNNDSSSACA
jgi:hypothetical protein